jgi:DNA-binding NarL/FixJ family response regulator
MTALKSRPAQPRKRIYIVEDHPTFREGLVQIFNSEGDLTVCGMAGTVDQALPGIAHTRTVKLLVISMHDEALYAARVLRLGGDGYIMKQEDPDEIVDAIHDVLAGHIYVSEEVMESAKSGRRGHRFDEKTRPLDLLTDSELEVLELVGRGKSSLEIARKLRLSESSVTAARSQLREKLRLKNAQALFRYAVRWVESDGG